MRIEDKEWQLIDPPRPRDECIYDIQLKDGGIIEDVEFWAFKDVFIHREKEISSQQVYKFKLVKNIFEK